jgi:cysteine desulfurase
LRSPRGRGHAALLHREVRQPRRAATTSSAGRPKTASSTPEQVAALIGADAKEIVFTSGATESNNLAIKGAATCTPERRAGQRGRGHIITAAHEHKAVLDPCKRLQKEGFDVTFLEPNRPTASSPGPWSREPCARTPSWSPSCGPTTRSAPSTRSLRSAPSATSAEVIFHTDATQWVGKMPTDVDADNIDLLS